MFRLVAQVLREAVLGLGSALLPDPERRRLAERTGVNPPRWSLLVGAVQVVAGLTLYVARGLAYMCPAMTEQGMLLLENWDGLRDSGHQVTNTMINWGGLLTWFAWNLQPEAWLYLAVLLIGIARCAAFAITREAVGEPAVWAGLRLGQLLRRRARARRRETALGPPRPDRFVPGRDGELVLLTTREQAAWNERVTIEVRGRFYRLERVEDRRDGPWMAIAYVLQEQPDEEVVRGIVLYEEWSPPPPASGSRGPS